MWVLEQHANFLRCLGTLILSSKALVIPPTLCVSHRLRSTFIRSMDENVYWGRTKDRDPDVPSLMTSIQVNTHLFIIGTLQLKVFIICESPKPRHHPDHCSPPPPLQEVRKDVIKCPCDRVSSSQVYRFSLCSNPNPITFSRLIPVLFPNWPLGTTLCDL